MNHTLLAQGPNNAKALWDLVDSDESVLAAVGDVVTVLDIGLSVSGVALPAALSVLATAAGIFFSAVGPFLAIAAPLADAKLGIQRRQSQYGYNVGLITAASGHNIGFARGMLLKPNTGGFMHPGVRGVAERSFNTAFAGGYAAGIQASPPALMNLISIAEFVTKQKGEARLIDPSSTFGRLFRLGANLGEHVEKFSPAKK